jgi:hypothetical protein
MKRSIILCFGFIFSIGFGKSFNAHHEDQFAYRMEDPDSLPSVFTGDHADLIDHRLRLEAALKFVTHQLPNNLEEWRCYSSKLSVEIILKTGFVLNHKLPLNMRESGTVQMKGYSVKNIAFQTRPGVYATANLYVPEGSGPFPAVIFMIGHWELGKIEEMNVQPVGHTLASNGYVCLCIDPWGSGERTTIHGTFEDHGDNNNLGSSLMNIGETQLGIELSDNIRGVDLLCSLPYVDAQRIGATGASGGGNQTMWLTAMDERVKAAVPVVSAGTFESYIMGTPCICEVVPGGLTFTEESGILALIAPRAIKMCNHQKDDNKAFYPREMLRSYQNARPVFKMLGAENNITYQLFDLPHGYERQDREAMLGWFDLHLKGIGNGDPRKEVPFEVLPKEKLMVYASGKRESDIVTTEAYCRKKGYELRTIFLNRKTFDLNQKKNDLRRILKLNEGSALKDVHQFSNVDGWARIALETSDNKLIPVLLRLPSGDNHEFVIVSNPDGKGKISPHLLKELTRSGRGIAVVDLSGTGEAASALSGSQDNNGNLRTLSRSLLWFDKTVLGEWVKELQIVSKFLTSEFNAQRVSMDGTREAGLAALFLGASEGTLDHMVLREVPISYLFDSRETVDFFSTGVNLPGFLNWGDVSLAAAISGIDITMINPVTMSGQKLEEGKLKEVQTEFERIRKICGQPGTTVFK